MIFIKVEILAIGTELLLGDILNTNAQFISRELATLGMNVFYQGVVGDNGDRLLEYFKKAFERSDIIITTGGLGPTKDDLTKEIGARYFKKELVKHEESITRIEKYFKKLKTYKMTENNYKQGYFPENSVILKNNNGTAPGCIIEENNKILIMLPGPPREMIAMFKESVLPYLAQKSELTFYSNRLRVFGVGESAVEEKLSDLLKNQSNPTIATYAKNYEVEIRLTAQGKDIDDCKNIIKPTRDAVYDILGTHIYGEDDIDLETVIVKKLLSHKKTIAVAESFTGGMVSSKLINVSGASETFLEGVVTYSDESKVSRLNVNEETLKEFGAVSKEVAMEMAKGVAQNLKTDIGLATTGIAGPTGATKNKPVGLIYIGLSIDGEVYFLEKNLSGSREVIRDRGTMIALDFLRGKL